MLQTVLKHFIYEICIDVLFKNVVKHFHVKRHDTIPTVGDFYKIVSHIYAEEHYNNCVVKSVQQRKTTGGEDYYLVFITYESYGGSDLDSMQEELEEFDESDLIIINDSNSISELFDEGDIEFIEYDGYVALNTLYYNFYK